MMLKTKSLSMTRELVPSNACLSAILLALLLLAALAYGEEYLEIDKGTFQAGRQLIDLGYPSDWAIAVGQFEQR